MQGHGCLHRRPPSCWSSISAMSYGGPTCRHSADSTTMSTSDLLVTAWSTLLSTSIWRQFGWALADPIFAGFVGVYILFTAWRIAQSSLDLLMDRELPDSERRRIREIALANPVVRDLHDLRTRSSGQATFIQFHLGADGATPIQAHTSCRRSRGCHSDRVSGVRSSSSLRLPPGYPERRRRFAWDNLSKRRRPADICLCLRVAAAPSLVLNRAAMREREGDDTEIHLIRSTKAVIDLDRLRRVWL